MFVTHFSSHSARRLVNVFEARAGFMLIALCMQRMSKRKKKQQFRFHDWRRCRLEGLLNAKKTLICIMFMHWLSLSISCQILTWHVMKSNSRRATQTWSTYKVIVWKLVSDRTWEIDNKAHCVINVIDKYRNGSNDRNIRKWNLRWWTKEISCSYLSHVSISSNNFE